MKPITIAIIVAVVLALGAGIYFGRRAILLRMEARGQKENLDKLVKHIDQNRLKEGYEVIEGLAAKRKAGIQDTAVKAEINRSDAELKRLAESVGKQNPMILRGDYEAWLKMTYSLLIRLETEGRPMDDRWKNAPPDRSNPSRSAAPPTRDPLTPDEKIKARMEGRIFIKLNPACHGPCNVKVQLKGVAEPSVLLLKPGQIKKIMVMDGATVEMEETRPYCKDKPLELNDSMIGQTIEVGCRP